MNNPLARHWKLARRWSSALGSKFGVPGFLGEGQAAVPVLRPRRLGVQHWPPYLTL